MYEIEGSFGERLKEERLRLLLTRDKLAEEANVSSLSISQYENGRSTPSIKFIYAINRLQFDIIYVLLAVRKESITQTYSPEVCKRVAKEIDLLEFKLGGNLESEARVAATLSLLNYFDANPQEIAQTLTPSQWLSKILSQALPL